MLQARKVQTEGLAWRAHDCQRSTSGGRTQTTRYEIEVVYMGPSSPIPPVLLLKLATPQKLVATHSKPIELPPPYGGEQRRKGKGYPNPSKGHGAVSQVLTAEPQYRSGALKPSQFNAYQFTGVIPPFSGLKGSAGL